MKIIKIVAVLLFGTLLFCALRSPEMPVKTVGGTSSNVATPKTATPLQHFEEQLAQEEKEVWQTLHEIGITRKRFEETYKKYCLTPPKQEISSKPLSKKTISFIEKMLKERNIDSNEITISAFPDENEQSPAAANSNVFYVNENRFNELNEPVQTFIIAHEIEHIIHKDASRITIVEFLYERDTQPGAVSELIKNEQKDHPVLALERFQERRADIMAVVKHPELIEGYLAYSQQRFEQCGDTKGLTHPTYTERIKLAENIIDYTNNYQTIKLQGDFTAQQTTTLI